jgi:hypothetical protein
MSDVILKIDNDLKLKIVQQNVVLKFYNVITVPTIPTDFPSYANDTEARADGLTTNDLYWFSADTDTGIYNTLKRVSPL